MGCYAESEVGETDVKMFKVELALCGLCMNGDGGECHSPGCALWINRGPDVPLHGNPLVKIIDCYEVETPKA